MNVMDHVLITGGAGFIGSHLADRLLSDGRRVIVLDNFDGFYDPAIKRRNVEPALRNPRYRLVEGDIRDSEALERLLLFLAFYAGLLLWGRLARPVVQQLWRLKWALLFLFVVDWLVVDLNLFSFCGQNPEPTTINFRGYPRSR